MEQRRTKLVEEENTIYEIDMECVRKKEEQRRQQKTVCDRKRPASGRRNEDFLSFRKL